MATIVFPDADGSVRPCTPGPPGDLPAYVAPASSRLACAAAHVVSDAVRASAEDGPDQIEWEGKSDCGIGCGTWDWVSPRPWTSRSGGWAWTGPRRASWPVNGLPRRAPGTRRSLSGSPPDLLPSHGADLAAVRAAYLEQLPRSKVWAVRWC